MMFVVVFGPLVGVFVFSVMWSELLMTSAISYPLWSSGDVMDVVFYVCIVKRGAVGARVWGV